MGINRYLDIMNRYINTRAVNRFTTLVIVLAFLGLRTQAQEFNPSENKTVYVGDTTLVFSVIPLPEKFNGNLSRRYYWYTNQQVRSNTGGAYGSLLHGKYRALLNGNRLVAEGSYRMGLRHGVWRTWDSSGSLLSVVRYKKGDVAKTSYPTPVKKKKEGRSLLKLVGKGSANEPHVSQDSTVLQP